MSEMVPNVHDVQAMIAKAKMDLRETLNAQTVQTREMIKELEEKIFPKQEEGPEGPHAVCHESILFSKDKLGRSETVRPVICDVRGAHSAHWNNKNKVSWS